MTTYFKNNYLYGSGGTSRDEYDREWGGQELWVERHQGMCVCGAGEGGGKENFAPGREGTYVDKIIFYIRIVLNFY